MSVDTRQVLLPLWHGFSEDGAVRSGLDRHCLRWPGDCPPLDELGALTRKQATGTFDGSEVPMAERFIVVCSLVDLWREAATRRGGLSWWRVRSG